MSFLPGMQGVVGMIAAAPPVLTSISLFGSATSLLSTITAPASIIAGDLLVLVDRAVNDVAVIPTDAIPSGFTSLNSVGLTSVRQTVSYKLAVGTEGGAVLSGMTGGAAANPHKKALYVFRGNVPATLVTPSTPIAQIADFNPADHVIGASAGVSPLVVLVAYGASSSVTSGTFTAGGVEVSDGSLNPGGATLLFARKIYNSAPADITMGMGDEGSGNTLQGFYIEMSN